MIVIYIPRRLAEEYYRQGWRISVWRSYPHRAHSVMAWRPAV